MLIYILDLSWRIFISDEPEPEFSSSSRAMKVPSRAELGHFNFRAETELTSDSMYVKKLQNYIENLLILDFFHN